MKTGQFRLPKGDMQIMLLGPGEAQPVDYAKRIGILEQLHKSGYNNAKLGEEVLGEPETPLQLALLDAVPHSDLILVLDTGVAPVVELTTLWRDYRARRITRVWCHRKFMHKRRTAPTDIVKSFDYKVFSQTEFDKCELTEDFIQASDRACFDKAQREGLLSDRGLLSPVDDVWS